MEELEAIRSQVQQELNVQSFGLETIQAQLAAKKLLTNKELRSKVLAEIEETHQRDIQYLMEHIKSLAQ